jgi:hypothetical protein
MEVINREKGLFIYIVYPKRNSLRLFIVDLITFRFRHKREYAEMQRRFFSAVVTLDPQIFKGFDYIVKILQILFTHSYYPRSDDILLYK